MLPKIKTFFTQKKKKNQTFFFDEYESICLSVLLIKTRIFCMKKLIKLSFPFLILWLCVYREINHVFEIAENSRFLNTINLRVFSNTLMKTHICVYCQSFFLMNETYCIIMTKIPNNNLIPCHHRSPLYFVPLSLSPLYLQLMSFCPLSLNFLFRCHCTAVLSSSFCLNCILWARTKT